MAWRGKVVGSLFGFAALVSVLLIGSRAVAVDFAKAIPPEYRVGGKFALGCQAYSFNRYTFVEAVDKTKETGCRLIEVFPGQKLSAEKPIAFNHDAPPDVCEAAKKKCDEAGVKMVAYGVVGLGKDEASMRKVFDFAKKMGILVIVAEPEESLLPLVDKLAKEYDIPVTLHNHPKPSRYWDPKHELESIQNIDKMVGSCADTGHWMRSEVNPLEALKMLEGRIVSMHIKDLNQMGRDAHDVPFGTGQANMKAILDELERQKFNGIMSMEYEYNWTTSVPEIKQCVEFVKAYAANPASVLSIVPAPATEKPAEEQKATTEGKAGKKGGKRGGGKKKGAAPEAK